MMPAIVQRDAQDVSGLPAMIDRACERLAEARTSAEVLEAKAIGEAALAYARVTEAANETHADCLRMIVRAEMRMADEIDRGQQRGEVAVAGNPIVRGADNSEVSLQDLGVSRQRLSEWRETRDVGAIVVDAAIDAALLDGRVPTKTDVRRAVQDHPDLKSCDVCGRQWMADLDDCPYCTKTSLERIRELNAEKLRQPHVANNSGNNEWYTPAFYIAAAVQAMGAIDVDPASSAAANKTVRAKTFYSADNDGLTKTWTGNVWMNPPYATPLIGQFADAVSDKYDAKEIKRACVLVNNATETGWFQRMLTSASAVCFIKGRVRFMDPDGNPSGAPLQGQAVLYLGDDPYRFARCFGELGQVLVKPS
jgi:phage N-6-adenine-methyltransferase